ncbi:O-antigen ligase [Actinomycetospora sp. TBRC 11914]|uniref:O-antigen ligase family protein n=1 Tax=Actinomycetospora sp. TBRC 11914 TaxID=2729387 RepID=UPI00145E261E|nr:O-antigen ligase family protein [Actinomycetospora sp. TBRC 11914]NMO90290.1 hypothetical protein [Actinomycetospora sp. TBRC 11914]
MNVLLLGFAVAVAAGLGIALLDVTIRRAEVGAALVFLSAIIQAVFIFAVPSVSVGGMRVGCTDVAAVIVLAAAAARCLRLRRFGRYQYWLLLLSVLLLVSLVLGMAQHGIQTSVSDSRQYLFFVGAALYMATFRPAADLYDRIGRIWLMAAVLMILLACARWMRVFAGVDLGVPAERYGVDTAVRVLDGPYAFFLAGPLLLTVPFWLRRGQQARWVPILGAVLLVVLIALDRRTVWLAVVIGISVLLLRGRRLGARSVALVVAASIVTVLTFAGDVQARDQVPAGAVTSTGSVTWRVEGWSDVIASWSASPVSWLIGTPFGGGFARTIDGSSTNAHPHNFYIETMIRAGLGGLIALLALTVGLLRRVWRIPVGATRLLEPGVLAPLLAMQLVWYITWVPGLEQGIVTGMAVAVALAGARRGAAGRLGPAGPSRSRPGGPAQPAARSAPPGARTTCRPPPAHPSRDADVAAPPPPTSSRMARGRPGPA